MGLFKRKKKKKEVTLRERLFEEIEKRDEIFRNYEITRNRINKLITKYYNAFTNYIYINDKGITLHLKEKFYDKFPDGFLAEADRLDLTVDPLCNRVAYGQSLQRPICVRAKEK